MLKASALYIVIIVALAIGLICSSLVVMAYFYRLQYQKTLRYYRLQNNLSSAINISLCDQDTIYDKEKIYSIYQNSDDSVSCKKIIWGINDVELIRAFIQEDTLYKVLSVAHTIDSTKWGSIYLVDNGNPIAIGGKTGIIGNVFLPKSGIMQTFVDNKPYTGNKRLVDGIIGYSAKTLPNLIDKRLKDIQSMIVNSHNSNIILPNTHSLQNSFLKQTQTFDLSKDQLTLKNIHIIGNIILFSDTSLVLDSTVVLKNVMVFAKSITLKTGFHGNCQLFATDSVNVERNCCLDYPSCIGILRFSKPQLINKVAYVHIGSASTVGGLIFTYERIKNPTPPIISIDSKVKVCGQIYSMGTLALSDSSEIDGSVITSQFLYHNLYGDRLNLLNNVKINLKSLSKYYLTTDLIPVASKKRKVLQWLETN